MRAEAIMPTSVRPLRCGGRQHHRRRAALLGTGEELEEQFARLLGALDLWYVPAAVDRHLLGPREPGARGDRRPPE